MRLFRGFGDRMVVVVVKTHIIGVVGLHFTLVGHIPTGYRPDEPVLGIRNKFNCILLR